MKILFILGFIGGINNFSVELGHSLESIGGKAYFLRMEEVTAEALITLKNGGVQAVVCYDSHGLVGKEALYDALDLPVFNAIVDHPMTLNVPGWNPPRKYVQGCVDELHVAYTRDYCSIDRTYFLPHPASVKDRPQDIPADSRDIPILFPARFCSPNEMYQIVHQKLENTPRMLQMVIETIEFLISNSRYPMEIALS